MALNEKLFSTDVRLQQADSRKGALCSGRAELGSVQKSGGVGARREVHQTATWRWENLPRLGAREDLAEFERRTPRTVQVDS